MRRFMAILSNAVPTFLVIMTRMSDSTLRKVAYCQYLLVVSGNGRFLSDDKKTLPMRYGYMLSNKKPAKLRLLPQ